MPSNHCCLPSNSLLPASTNPYLTLALQLLASTNPYLTLALQPSPLPSPLPSNSLLPASTNPHLSNCDKTLGPRITPEHTNDTPEHVACGIRTSSLQVMQHVF